MISARCLKVEALGALILSAAYLVSITYFTDPMLNQINFIIMKARFEAT